jgi:hypothetical protein
MQDELFVTLDEGDFIEAYRPPQRSRRLRTLVLLLALALALLIVALLVRFPGARDAFEHSRLTIGLTGAVGLAASLVTALLVAAPSLRRRAARNTLENHPGLRDPVHYAFDADRFSVRTTYTQAVYPWAQLWDWRETDRVLIVLPTPRNFYVLPKRDVDPAVLDRLRGYLAHARKRARLGRAS